MKAVVVAVVALCAVTFAEVDFSANNFANSNEGFYNIQQGPYSLKANFNRNEGYVFDEQVLMEEILGRSFIAEIIQNALENLRDVVINGKDSVPPLDPLIIDSAGPFEFETTGARVTANINNFRAEGLRWYVVDYVTFNALRLTLGTQVTLPWLIVTGSYDAEARVAWLLTHRAGGNFRVFVNRFEVGVDARLGTSLLGGHLLLRDLDIRLFIADVNIGIDGMTGSSIINSFINSFVQSLTQDIIQNHLDGISKIISDEVFDTINDFLKDYTINDILG